MFIGRTDVEAETPILWPPDAKSWLIRKDPDSGKDWRQEEKGTTEDELVGRHHRLNGHEFGWTPGVGDGQGGLTCCGSWGRKESDATERLNWTELLQSAWLWPVDALKAVFHAALVRVWGFWVNHSIWDAHLDCSTQKGTQCWEFTLEFLWISRSGARIDILDLFCAFLLMCDRYSDDNSGNMTHASEFSPLNSVLFPCFIFITIILFFYTGNFERHLGHLISR